MNKKSRLRILLIVLPLCILTGNVKYGMSQELPKTKYLLLLDRPAVGVRTVFELKNVVEIKDGMDLSRQYLEGARINRRDQVLEGINFDRADLTNADLRETVFVNCSFKNANLTNVNASNAAFINCDFEGALINGAKITLRKEQLLSLWSRSLYRVETRNRDLSGMDFSKFNLIASTLIGDLTDCDFTDAALSFDPNLSGPPGQTSLGGTLTKEQLMSTSSYKAKQLMYVWFTGLRSDTPDVGFTGLDLSRFNLTGATFTRNLKDVNLTDAVITHCNFSLATNLTLDQIKSTWNYKTGNMQGVTLPRELQEQLDAERQAKEESP